MRTLGSQVRLRRLIRTFGECERRLAETSGDERLPAAVERRLRDQLGGLREAWSQESQGAASHARPLLSRYATRGLARMEAVAAALGRPGADLDRLASEFMDVALPLTFYLRGLEEFQDDQLASLLAGGPLARTA